MAARISLPAWRRGTVEMRRLAAPVNRIYAVIIKRICQCAPRPTPYAAAAYSYLAEKNIARTSAIISRIYQWARRGNESAAYAASSVRPSSRKHVIA